MPDPVREDPMNRKMEEAQAPKADIEHLEDGIFVPEPACEVELIAEERPVLMDKKFKDYIFIAHKAKGFDGYFIVSQLLKEKMGVKLITQGGILMCTEVTRLEPQPKVQEQQDTTCQTQHSGYAASWVIFRKLSWAELIRDGNQPIRYQICPSLWGVLIY
ncbi:hypothetical protein Y1Q_0021900 [Alligator mississippiensis]|uniref:Uncharacterized protein n=1 Tax=Alligator mississippiensis TaxID=8496 RepID=A0A151M616_ALLMI|nr:hypothetical protein Y1Q_0021900 [Alligator mississippiensis]